MLAGIPTLVWDKSLIVRECPELLRRTHNYNFAPRPIDGIVRIRLLRSNRYAIQSGRADYGLGLPHYGDAGSKTRFSREGSGIAGVDVWRDRPSRCAPQIALFCWKRADLPAERVGT